MSCSTKNSTCRPAALLAKDRLTEACQAIGALRGEDEAVIDRFGELIAHHRLDLGLPAELVAEGVPRAVVPVVGSPLYRAASRHGLAGRDDRTASGGPAVTDIWMLICDDQRIVRDGLGSIVAATARGDEDEAVSTRRLEAFSDGVIAILITIMVLELKIPHGTTLRALRLLLPTGLTYVLSFTNLGIYWNNHHHMLQATERVNGAILWANLHLLFWISLIPVATGWMGHNGFATLPTAAYGVVLLLSAVAYFLLQAAIIADQGEQSKVRGAVGRDWKGKASPAIYLVAIGMSFADRWVGLMLYVLVAVMWLVPDRRMERVLARTSSA